MKLSRRDFVKVCGAGVAATSALALMPRGNGIPDASLGVATAAGSCTPRTMEGSISTVMGICTWVRMAT
jgi:anaerobic selenocysteine-containing dehydrogenase